MGVKHFSRERVIEVEVEVTSRGHILKLAKLTALSAGARKNTTWNKYEECKPVKNEKEVGEGGCSKVGSSRGCS